jgi:hypothetical protein
MSSNAQDWLVDAETAGRPLDGTSVRATLEALVDAGARHAPRTALAHALRGYWSLLHHSTREERAAMQATLRERVRSGATTHQAWLPVALGETDGALAMSAVYEYLGSTPISLAKRTAAIADAIDWIRRALPMHRSAVFAALIAHADEATLVELRRVRGLLSRDEAAGVFALSAGCERDAPREFLARWHEALDA